MNTEPKEVDVSNTMWSIYQNIGHYHSEITGDKDKLKEFIQELRDAADQLESTLPV